MSVGWLGAGAGSEAQPDRKRRRRSGNVDYRALDEQLRAERSAPREDIKMANNEPE